MFRLGNTAVSPKHIALICKCQGNLAEGSQLASPTLKKVEE